jgi:hypothetical protein
MHCKHLASVAVVGCLYVATFGIASCGGGTDGTKTVEVCPSNLTDCDTVCVDTDNDPANCGACGTACGETEYCSGGSCTEGGGGCQPPLTDCDGTCTDVSIDTNNCGACGTTCADGEKCNGSGQCALSCQAGLVECSGTCIDPLKDNAYCGASGDCLGANAGTTCADGTKCDGAGACALSCQAGFLACGGVCTDPKTSNAHCGASSDCLGANAGTICADGMKCNGAGVCALSCQTGLLACGGVCTDPKTSNAHCGASSDCLGANAGNSCAAGMKCNGAGVCALSCQTGLVACSGTCIDPTSNPSFCGASGNCLNANAGTVCGKGKACVAGACVKVLGPATCTEMQTTVTLWGHSVTGFDLRARTSSTLHFVGCVDTESGCKFYCTYNQTAQTLAFGSNATGDALRAQVDPGNAAGDSLTGGSYACSTASTPNSVSNAPNSTNNGVAQDPAKALCRALGYSTGSIVRQVNDNTCPEVHTLDSTGNNWTSDFVSSPGYGAEYLCTGFL